MTSRQAATIATETTFDFPAPRRGERILLLNPPVYDAQYWARWSQPAGLLRIATYLKRLGYGVDLIDCMETDARGIVPKSFLLGKEGERKSPGTTSPSPCTTSACPGARFGEE